MDEGSCCSCDEEDLDKVSDGTAAGTSAAACDVETQTDAESPSSSITSVFDPGGEKITRLCNINELLRQIDEQFNSVLRATSNDLPDLDLGASLSPSNSDDVRGSETEADRACTQFYGGTGEVVNLQTADGDGEPLSNKVKPVVRPVVRPVPVVPHSPSPSGPPHAARTLGLIPYRGFMGSEIPADRLPSHASVTMPISSSPATVASDGYHSDQMPASAEPGEFPVIIREIPKSATATAGQFLSDRAVRQPSKHLNSPDDVDV